METIIMGKENILAHYYIKDACKVTFAIGELTLQSHKNVAKQQFCHVFSLYRVAKIAAGIVFFQKLLHFCIIFPIK